MSKELQVNEEIRDREIRLIDTDGKQLGIMSAKEALSIATEKQLDLVKVSPDAKPPVCKLMDYGKYRYELSKKEKEARKNQKVINIKEIRMTPSIEEHDFMVKVRNALRFLEDGDKVKVTIRFRGRELDHTSLAEELLYDFAEKLKDVGKVEKKPELEGKNMSIMISPITAK
ncbi:MAG: translation initiation factor IF-3 [Thermoanaerobacteraceae bacterium]|nr:translation initiation factor IF-3 [Thermoanaerobacteraceae bacterium]